VKSHNLICLTLQIF